MEAYEAILTRRSVRQYTDEAIDEAAVQKLVHAGMYAPSARNARPWHFIVIQDKAVLAAIADGIDVMHMLTRAALGIVVCGDPALVTSPHKEYYVQDCAAATENILLAAHALGLGAVWCGSHPKPDVKKHVAEVLGIPEGVVPVSVIAIGHPAEKPAQPDRAQPDRIHREKW